MVRYQTLFALVSILLLPGIAWADLQVIGSPVSAELVEEECSKFLVEVGELSAAEAEKVVCLDRVFRLRFVTIDNPKGHLNLNEQVEVFDFYHGRGLPLYLLYDPIWLSVEERPYGYLLKQALEVTKIKGEWVTCKQWVEVDGEPQCQSWKAVSGIRE